jgi:hypothetical protein
MNIAGRNHSRRVTKSYNRELNNIGFQEMGGEGTSVPDWSKANLYLGYPAPKISRLACFLIITRPLTKLEEDIPELILNNIL